MMTQDSILPAISCALEESAKMSLRCLPSPPAPPWPPAPRRPRRPQLQSYRARAVPARPAVRLDSRDSGERADGRWRGWNLPSPQPDSASTRTPRRSSGSPSPRTLHHRRTPRRNDRTRRSRRHGATRNASATRSGRPLPLAPGADASVPLRVHTAPPPTLLAAHANSAANFCCRQHTSTAPHRPGALVLAGPWHATMQRSALLRRASKFALPVAALEIYH